MPAKPIELIFPLKGIDETWAFGRQPDGTTPAASNVVPYDTLDTRARGGQRWGLSKYYTSLHNSTNAIQRMSSSSSVASTSVREDDVAVSGSLWTTYPSAPAFVTPAYTYTGQRSYTLTDAYTVVLKLKVSSIVDDSYTFGVLLRVDSTYNDEFYTMQITVETRTAGGGGGRITSSLYSHASGGETLVNTDTVGWSAYIATLLSAGTNFQINVTAAGVIAARFDDLPDIGIDHSPGMTLYSDNSLVGVSNSADWEGGSVLTFEGFEMFGEGDELDI